LFLTLPPSPFAPPPIQEIKREFLFKKIPGDQVRARSDAIASRDRLRAEHILIKQRKARQHQLRVQYKHRQYENYKKERELGISKRPPLAVPKEKPRESTQPVKKKDWRYYRRGDTNLWTDYYHVPLNRLEHVIPEIAIEKDKEAVNRVMKILAEEDELEEQREKVKVARAQRLRNKFTQQMERNRMRDDYVFKSAPPSSRPASAAAIRSGAPGVSGGPPQSRKKSNNIKSGEHAFALDGKEANGNRSGTAKGPRPQSAPVSRKKKPFKGKGKGNIFDRLSEPKKPAKKHELVMQTGCAELNGMLVTDKALQEQLQHLSKIRKEKKGESIVRMEEEPLFMENEELAAVAMHAQEELKVEPEEVKRAKAELEQFQERLEKNPATDDGIYMNPYSMYDKHHDA